LRNKESGMTLIEITVSVALIVSVTVAALVLFMQGIQAHSDNQSSAVIVGDLRGAIERMSSTLRGAQVGSIVVTMDGRQVTLQAWDNTINSFRTHTFSLVGTQIVINGSVVAHHIQSLGFVLLDSGMSVSISATTLERVEGARTGGLLPVTLNTRVAVRR